MYICCRASSVQWIFGSEKWHHEWSESKPHSRCRWKYLHWHYSKKSSFLTALNNTMLELMQLLFWILFLLCFSASLIFNTNIQAHSDFWEEETSSCFLAVVLTSRLKILLPCPISTAYIDPKSWSHHWISWRSSVSNDFNNHVPWVDCPFCKINEYSSS